MFDHLIKYQIGRLFKVAFVFFASFCKIIVRFLACITFLLYICAVIKNQSTMKWNELRRIAEKKGWKLYRNGANHDIYQHPDSKEPLLIGRHGKQEIPTGTFNKIKKQIGL